ncbi:type II toxin-antitoxin system ParD family antitoxin [Rhizobium sp. Root708]|uniref:type II toxin-antitoxin system ParD family antitoxin n=1 Tax=Rhizobium sp. Root708 TaxID=1736592 RepID=UPI000AE2DEBD|nr:type II toxin-antitoxin system ParD family antitoxin [Rhizobium sp. Root708]
MRTLTISLTPHQAARMQDAVDSGGYASNSEIVRDALRLWEQREEIRHLEIARLKRAYDEGIASGEGREVDADILLAELKAEKRSRG